MKSLNSEKTVFIKQDGAQYVKKIKAIFSFKILNGPGGKSGVWMVDVKSGNGSVKYGVDGKLKMLVPFT